MLTLKRILVPTDFSECSDAAVQWSLELAREFDATLHLLHVVEDPGSSSAAAAGFPLPLGEILDQFQAEGRKRLLQAVPEEARARVIVACPVASPVAEILRYAQDEAIDLVVMGTHGRGFIAHALIGSVAERVVRRAPCPVLTVRDTRDRHRAAPCAESVAAVAVWQP